MVITKRENVSKVSVKCSGENFNFGESLISTYSFLGGRSGGKGKGCGVGVGAYLRLGAY